MTGSGIIYKTTNLVNGKIYVGIHTGGNENYLGSGKILRRAIEKYGKDSFSRIIIDEFDSLDVGIAKEIYWICELNSKLPNGYNINAGGGGRIGVGQYCHSEEARKNISLSKRGRPSPMKGKKRNPEFGAKISATTKGRKGKPASEETKARLRFSHLGIPKSPETIKKLRESALSYWRKKRDGVK